MKATTFYWARLALAAAIIQLVACASMGVDPAQSNNPRLYINPDVGLTPYLSPTSDQPLPLSDQLAQNWAMVVDVVAQDGSRVYQVDSCQKLFEADQEGAEPAKPYEYTAYRALAADCYASRLVSQAEPATVSHIGTFDLAAIIADELPWQLAFIVSTAERARIEKNRPGARWSDVEDIQSVERVEENKAIFHTAGGRQEVTVLAKADFNEDAYEDIVLHVRNDAVGGSYVSHHVFLLTRKDEAGFQLLQEF